MIDLYDELAKITRMPRQLLDPDPRLPIRTVEQSKRALRLALNPIRAEIQFCRMMKQLRKMRKRSFWRQRGK